MRCKPVTLSSDHFCFGSFLLGRGLSQDLGRLLRDVKFIFRNPLTQPSEDDSVAIRMIKFISSATQQSEDDSVAIRSDVVTLQW